MARLGTLSPLSSRVSSCRFLCLVFSCLAPSGLTSSFLLPSCPVSSCLASSCLLLACLTSGVANRHSFGWYRGSCFLLRGPLGASCVLQSCIRQSGTVAVSFLLRGYKPLGAPSPLSSCVSSLFFSCRLSVSLWCRLCPRRLIAPWTGRPKMNTRRPQEAR